MPFTSDQRLEITEQWSLLDQIEALAKPAEFHEVVDAVQRERLRLLHPDKSEPAHHFRRYFRRKGS